MGMEAVALVRIEASVLASGLKAAGPSGTELVGANGETLTIAALDDASLIFTSVSVRDADPDQLGGLIRALIGDTLDRHDDDRGVFTFPKAALPAARTYAAAIEEVGEMGEWAPRVTAADLEERGGDFAAVAGDLLEGLGPDVMDLQRRMMAGEPGAMQDAMKQVGAMLSDPSKKDALMQAVAALSGQGSTLQDMAANLPMGGGIPNPADLMKNMDLGALQEQAQKMMADNPNLEKELMEKLGGKDED